MRGSWSTSSLATESVHGELTSKILKGCDDSTDAGTLCWLKREHPSQQALNVLGLLWSRLPLSAAGKGQVWKSGCGVALLIKSSSWKKDGRIRSFSQIQIWKMITKCIARIVSFCCWQCVHVCAHVCVRVCACARMCVCACVHACVCARMCVCVRAWRRAWVGVHAVIWAGLCVCVCVCLREWKIERGSVGGGEREREEKSQN